MADRNLVEEARAAFRAAADELDGILAVLAIGYGAGRDDEAVGDNLPEWVIRRG